MQEAIEKSKILIEALPYIEAFQKKAVVVKYGGSAIVDKKKRRMVLQDIIFMRYAGMHPVLIHGGGPFIDKRLKKSRIKSTFVRGLRVTDGRSLKIIKDVLYRVNRQIVGEIRRLGGKAQGITGKRRIIRVKRSTRFGDIGFVGEITSINTEKIEDICERGIIPVICPLGVGRDGAMYNVNADEASAHIASQLSAEKLALLTNVDGILKNVKDGESLISSITVKQVKGMMARKKIASGMIPKVKAAMTALKNGVGKVHVINGGLTHALLLEIFTDEGIGTEITKR